MDDKESNPACDNLYILGKSLLANSRKFMDNNTYIIFDQDSGELIQVQTKITSANLNHVEVVQLVMIEQSVPVEDWAEITDPDEMNFKVYAVYAGNISPIYEDDLNCYVFEDKHYEALQQKLAEHEEKDQ